MSIGKIEDRIKKMKEAIHTQAKQRAQHIVERAEEEADVERVTIIREEKEKINNEFEKLHKSEQVKAKIQKSTVVNKQRIHKIEAMYKLVEELKQELKAKLSGMTEDPSQYGPFMAKLITQGLIRMMEKHVMIECKADDKNTIQRVMNRCQDQFAEIFKKETGKDLTATLTISPYYLEDKHKEIIGGVFMRSNDGMIVCDNSIDARVNLIFEQLLPEIRQMLFPRKI